MLSKSSQKFSSGIQGVKKMENISVVIDIHNTLSEQNEQDGIKVKMYSLDH